MYGLKIAKRPVRAKALIINAYALTGRIVFGGFLPQGGALGYVLLPLSGRTAVTFAHPLLYLLSFGSESYWHGTVSPLVLSRRTRHKSVV